ncbi:MAG: tetratricopeptide repeat protein [Elusimicrobiales bacterium]
MEKNTSGGMGVVLVCTHGKDETVVLKACTNPHVTSLKLFERETKNWLRLEPHPNIVTAHKVLRHKVPDVGSAYWLVLEYVAGAVQSNGDSGNTGYLLSNDFRINVKSLSQEMLLRCLLDICCGMEHMFKCDIPAHGDLKPDNILIDSAGRAKISDLGLSGMTTEGWHSYEYTAPELKDKIKRQSPNEDSDLYSLGRIIEKDVCPHIMDPRLCRKLKEIAKECLEDNPLLRPNDFAQVRRAFKRLYRSHFHRAYEPAPKQQPRADKILEKVASLLSLPVPNTDTILTLLKQAEKSGRNNPDIYFWRGVALSLQGYYAISAKDFARANRLRPDHIPTLYSRAISLLKMGHPCEAARMASQALKLGPSNIKVCIIYSLALAYSDKLPDALSVCQKAIKLDPANPEGYRTLALILLLQEKTDESIQAFQKTIALDPNDLVAQPMLGLIFGLQGKLEEADCAFQAAIDRNPRNILIYSQYGYMLEISGKYCEAEGMYKKVIELVSTQGLVGGPSQDRVGDIGNIDLHEMSIPTAEAHSSLGKLYAMQNRIEEAAAEYRAAIRCAPSYSGDFYCALGHVLNELGKPDEAVGEYTTAIDFGSDNASAYYGLGIALRKQGKLDEAIVAYQKAIELDPQDAANYNSLGFALEKQGKLDEAIVAHQKAIELDPKDATVQHNLGIALRKQGKLDEAIAAYRKAIELDPNDAAAYYDLGIAFDKQGKREESIAAYKKTIELVPDNASAYLSLGSAFADQGKMEDALVAYRKATALNPSSAFGYNGLGWLLHERGELAEAVAAYNKAIELSPTYDRAYNGLGTVLGDMGQFKEGAAACWKAIKLKPNSFYAYDSLGTILKKQGNLKGAVEAYVKAVTLEPRQALVRYNLGKALMEMGDNGPAKDQLSAGLVIIEAMSSPAKEDMELKNKIQFLLKTF